MKELKALLDKYWSGNSDVNEEKALKNFLSDAPSSPDAHFFRYLNEKSAEGIGDEEFDKRMLAEIQNSLKNRNIPLWKNWKVAAVILLLIAATFSIRQGVFDREAAEQEVLADTYEDPEKAFEETKKALLLISTKLNEGAAYSAEIGKFSESQEKLKKQ